MKCAAVLLVLTVPSSTARAADDAEFFETKVRPLLAERCFKCHSASAKKQKGGLLLDGRAALLKGGDGGPAVVPGRPDDSLLVKAVRYQSESLQMPPDGKLPERDIAALEDWVRRGAAFPGPATAVTAKAPPSLVEGRNFWSFRPLNRATPSVPRDAGWPRGRLDAFVLAELEKRGLVPSPPADRRTLIRRATFDLTGLPPTPEEIEAFVADAAPDAYERLVERLLASPAYGERWARFWLDLARYADVTEEWADAKAPSSIYRDWVVKTLNADLPYDDFATKQLAADLLPGADPEDLAALGFLGLSPTYWKELKLDKDVIRTVVAEEWEERVAAVTGTFLGLTAACARCHDHKFDPITTHDYYALAGVFASTRQADRPLLPAVVAAQVTAARDRVAALKKQIDKLQEKKPVSPEAAKQVAALAADAEKIRRETPHYDAPRAPAVEEASLFVLADGPNRTKLEHRPGVARDVAVQVRGNPTSAGPVVPRRFLAVLSPEPPKPFSQGSGRLELAKAIVIDAAPLAARVIVNRVWKHHFGSGIVGTPSDFGAQGERPTHPELLDDLAVRFVRGGWSLKALHREILLSATYRQSSSTQNSVRGTQSDPDNRWLSRMNRRRLEVEAWRDAMLAVSGSLRRELGGPALDLGDAKNQRRTLYGKVTRRELDDMLRLHDVPDATGHSASRVPTTTPLQALFVLNSSFVQRQSAALAKRLTVEAPDVEGRVRRAYLLLYGRPATDEEVRLAVEFLTEVRPGASSGQGAREHYAQILLGSNEFLFVD